MSDLMEDLAGTPREWARAVVWALGIVLLTWAVL